MKSFKPLLVAALMASLTLSLVRPALADLTADQVWNKTQQHIRSVKDYSLKYDYTGPKGAYKFEYWAIRPDQVKTKIVAGDNAGATLIYNPGEYGNQVRARKGMLGKGINLNDPKVAGTPVIQPVFDMLLEKTRGGTATLTGSDNVGGHAVYVLSVTASSGANHLVAVDKQTFDVLHWKYIDGEGTQDRTFYDIKNNVHPRIDF